jgi:outer membrane lipoprotein LolB
VTRPGWVVVLAMLTTACALPASWEARGRLAVNVADEAWHGTFAWRKAPERQQVDLAGPLGQGSARLVEDADGATLDLGDGHVVAGADTEMLLQRQFGWSLPLRGLRHWIGGQADPERAATSRHDAEGRLVGLEQDGWRIAFDRYREVVGDASLPHRVVLERDDLGVRLVVDSWRFGPGPGGG